MLPLLRSTRWRILSLCITLCACADTFVKGSEIDDDDFDIDLQYYGTVPSDVKSAASTAVARLEQVVVGDVTYRYVGYEDPIDLSNCLGLPMGSLTFVERTIDDLVVVVRVDSIDGSYSTLASALPCLIRDNHNLETIIGTITVDAADVSYMVSSGRLTEVLMHEFLHVLGIGSNWEHQGLITGVGTTNPRVTGAKALAECRGAAGGSGVCDGAVPAEDCENLSTTSCGGGTRESHWKESTFETELMTGYMEADVSVPGKLSRITIGGLEDLGYVVDYSAADAYSVPTDAVALRAGETGAQSGRLIPIDRAFRPRFKLTELKKVIPIGQ